jgi:hypothetical protein
MNSSQSARTKKKNKKKNKKKQYIDRTTYKRNSAIRTPGANATKSTFCLD